MPQLRELPPAGGEPGTEIAQRLLASAYDSVNAVLDTLEIMRLRGLQAGEEELRALQGRLTHQEEDLLRAAIVFTGAGLDATLKQLILDTLPPLLNGSVQAQEEFEGFATDRLGTGEIADTKMITRYLVASSPRAALISDYVNDLTGSSLQSVEEVQRVAGALGISDETLRNRITGLQDLFRARNEVTHELDLERPERVGDRTRRIRRLATTKRLCQEGLEVAQLIVNAVGTLLAELNSRRREGGN